MAKMDCARARFLIYAYLDREVSSQEGEAVSRHVSDCPSCAARAASARGLAHILRSRVDRRTVPERLRQRLHGVPAEPAARRRYPAFAAAASLLLMLLPLVSDTKPRTVLINEAGMVPSIPRPVTSLVSRKITGTFVCLECEARSEAGFCPLAHADHATGFCADNGELWQLMSLNRPAGTAEASLGRTATVEGVAFPESGFIRVSRVGY
jgi:anti-sigma factor (TIGR02949 family)